ncbi:MAG: integrase arm-type DNA-binding domain-containing protein [Pseudomonadota bacterium]
MPLTDTALKNAKPREKSYKLFDAHGLHVLINPTGSKLWRMKYRFAGKEKLLSFGPYPLVALKHAREKRDAARLLLLDGRDPSEERRSQQRHLDLVRQDTFAVVAEEFLAKAEKEGRAIATMKKLRWLIAHTEKHLADRPVTQIEAPEVLRMLRQVEERGTYETARRLKTITGSVFRYAIATGRAQKDPTEALKGALISPAAKPRAAILDRKELGRLLVSIAGMSGQPTTPIALQLLAMMACRPGELRLARWKEFDLEGATWQIPAERMKMRRPHRLPLAPQATSLLSDLHRITGGSELVLPSIRSWKKPISENTLNAGLRRIGYGSDQITAHGFRATFSTFANESGLWSVDAIERSLAHLDANEVRRAYARGDYWDERRRLAAWWAGELSAMKEEAKRQ